MYVHIYNIYIYFHFLAVTFPYFKRPSTGDFQDQLAKVHRRSRTEGEPSVPLEAWWKNKAVKPKSWIFMGFLWTNIWNDNGNNLSGYIWIYLGYIYITTILYGAFLSHGGSPSHHGCFKSKSWSSMTWMIRRIGGTPMTKRKPLYLAHRKYWDTIDRMVGWGFIWYCHHPCWFTGSLEEFNVSSWPWLNLLIFWRRGWTTNHIFIC